MNERMPEREIDITVSWPALLIEPEAVHRLVTAFEELRAEAPLPPGELSIVFVNNDAIADLHNQFMNDPSPTDVITFDGDAQMDFAGEVCVSAERAHQECSEQGFSFGEELSLYIAHGLLHLSGYDDTDETARAAMRAAEQRVMTHLRARNAVIEASVAKGS